MYINNSSKPSGPLAEKLSKLMEFTIQSSQANDSMLREIQESTDYITTTNPDTFEEFIKDGVDKFTVMLNKYDDLTIDLAKYKSLLNVYINKENPKP